MNKKQLPTGVRVLLGFISVLLCIALFACTLVTILVADVKLLTSKTSIQQLIKDFLFTTSAPARSGFAPAGALPGRNPVPIDNPEMGGLDLGGIDFSGFDFDAILSGENAADALVDAFFDAIGESAEEELPFTKEDVTQFMEESTIPEFISDKVAGIVSDVILGESTTTITKEDVMGLLEENKTLIEDTFKVEIPQEMIQQVGTMLEENNIMESIQEGVQNIVGSEIAPPVSPDDPKEEGGSGTSNNVSAGLELMDSITKGEVDELGFGELLVMVRFIASDTVLYSCIGVCLALIALLFLTNWGRPNAALRCGGIPCFIAGLLILIPSAVAQFAPALIDDLFFPAGKAIRTVLSLAGTISLGVTVFGLVLIIGGAVLGSVLKKKRIAAAVAEATAANEVSDLAEVLLAAEEPAEETAETSEEAEV